MTAAIRSPDSPRSRSARKPAAGPAKSKVTSIARARRAKTGPVLPNYSPADEQAQAQSSASVIKVLPDRQQQPVWLRSLLQAQRASSVAALMLLGGALSLYGLTVYGEQRWSQEYQKLETLRLREQQLSASSEVLNTNLLKKPKIPKPVWLGRILGTRFSCSRPLKLDRPLRHQILSPLSRREAVWKHPWAIKPVSKRRAPEGLSVRGPENSRI